MDVLTMRSIVSALLLLAVSSSIAADLDTSIATYYRGDYKTALDEWRLLAEDGNKVAQYNLGLMFALKKDYPNALKWYREAAKQGHTDALYNLGNMYNKGRGFKKEDPAEAVSLWREAAKKGHKGAQNNLGAMYAEGRGVKTEDPAEAVSLWREAAEKGHKGAQYNLGNAYRNGRGVERNCGEALKQYSDAAEGGFAKAQNNLGVMYADGECVEQSDRLAVYWYHKAADQGYAGAQYNLARRYEKGDGVPYKDDDLAMLWFSRAAFQGFADAQNSLGFKYGKGDGVPVDDIKAHAWLQLTSEQGIEQAKRNLNHIKQRMTSDQIAEAEELSSRLANRIANRREAVAAALWIHDEGEHIVHSRGSGFLVSRDGKIVTNDHVVFGCDIVVVNRAGVSYLAKLRARSFDLDLALLETYPDIGEPATFSESRDASLGEAVMVAGYPLRGSLPQDLNVTRGIVSKLSGQDDVRRLDQLQITAPIQAGNSGGPLLDGAGNVIGVVVSSLESVIFAPFLISTVDESMIENAMKDGHGNIYIKTDARLIQNVNFAIKGVLVRDFLKDKGVDLSPPLSSTKLATERLAEMAYNFTVSVQAIGHKDRCGNHDYAGRE